jgi:hypothetical protein
MSRRLHRESFLHNDALDGSGLTLEMLEEGLASTYSTLDAIDETLIAKVNARLSGIIEPTNLSSMLGNLLASGIAKASGGLFLKNRPHKYPDLLANGPGAADIEIKIALENNNPKGHLAKPGFYLTCRYVLCDETGCFKRGVANRGVTVWIWELRAGWLGQEHFNLSSTEGDSGKTAVVNALGMQNLKFVYCDLERFPGSQRGRRYRDLKGLFDLHLFDKSGR